MPDLLAAFARVQRAGKGWSAQCPSHEDARNSLSIGRGDGGCWLLNCHAGCTLDAILAAARLKKADLFPTTRSSTGSTVVATYDYSDASGALLYQIVRYAPKTFRPRRPDGAGGWISNLNGTTRVLYRLPELQGKRTAYVVEGEKDADRLWREGLPATTNPFGADAPWTPAYTAQLQAAGVRHVVTLPDNDPAGATHGRMVARACADAGLDVKLIPLPDLPPKGDVSDFLNCHSRDELVAIVKDAPLFDPAQRVAASPALSVTTVTDFLSESEEMIDWIVEDRIPSGGVVLFCGAPKAGKSTAVRQLAVAVARGEPWLNSRTTPGLVWLFCFEDQRSEIRRHLRKLGASPGDSLGIFTGSAPSDLVAQLAALPAKDAPKLIILDTLIRALNVKDLNDYAQVTAAFAPFLDLARRTGAALLLVHHASIHADRDGLNAILGSTGVAGSVDNVLVLRRAENRRTLSSVQRVGPDLEPTILTLDDASGRVVCAGTKRIVEDGELRDRIVEALAAADAPVRESWIHDQVEGRKTDKVRALRVLLSQGRVVRTGRGGRGDPYLYRLADSGSQPAGTRIDFADGREPAKPKKSAENPGLFDAARILVPDPPDIYREPESKTTVRTYAKRTSPYHDPILVPEGPKTAPTDPPITAKTPDKHGADSGSRILVPGDDEAF